MFFGYLKSKKGFSLVEVLVSTVLIALVFGGFVSTYYYSTNLRANSQKRLDAMLTAQACIEEIRSARGDTSTEWENRSELENWLKSTKSYIDNGGGEFLKDNVKIILGDAPQGNPAVLMPAGLFNLTVEVYYSDEMDKVKEGSVVLETRLGEL